MAALILLRPDATELGRIQAPLRDPTNVPIPFVEFEKTDVRVALSWLFQKVHIGYGFDPHVKGLVTVSLRNVTFEVALQNISRQADATYRIENGVYAVVNRDDSEDRLPALVEDREIDRAYERFQAGHDLARLAPSFRLITGYSKPSLVGNEARASFLRYVGRNRNYRILDSFRLAGTIALPTKAGVLVRYDLGSNAMSEDFWDVWVRAPKTPWRLFSRERSLPGE